MLINKAIHSTLGVFLIQFNSLIVPCCSLRDNICILLLPGTVFSYNQRVFKYHFVMFLFYFSNVNYFNWIFFCLLIGWLNNFVLFYMYLSRDCFMFLNVSSKSAYEQTCLQLLQYISKFMFQFVSISTTFCSGSKLYIS